MKNIFNRKSKNTLEQTALNHNAVLDYMLELDDEECNKLLQVVKVYRGANKKAAEIMGGEVDQDSDVLTAEILNKRAKPGSILDDEIDSAFLADDEEELAKAKP